MLQNDGVIEQGGYPKFKKHARQNLTKEEKTIMINNNTRISLGMSLRKYFDPLKSSGKTNFLFHLNNLRNLKIFIPRDKLFPNI